MQHADFIDKSAVGNQRYIWFPIQQHLTDADVIWQRERADVDFTLCVLDLSKTLLPSLRAAIQFDVW